MTQRPEGSAPEPPDVRPARMRATASGRGRANVAGGNITVNEGPPSGFHISGRNGVAALAVVAALVVGIVLAALILVRPTPSGSAAGGGSVQADAYWCCRAVSGENLEFYWPGSLPAADRHVQAGTSVERLPGIVPAGEAAIEIPVQTDSSEAIILDGLEVVVRSRRPSAAHGLILQIPPPGLGGATAAVYRTDLDSGSPRVLPSAAPGSTAPAQGFYYHVSQADPQLYLLRVSDTGYDCVFDVKLRWTAHGVRHQKMLTNGGAGFHVMGTAGLPWFHQNGPTSAFFPGKARK